MVGKKIIRVWYAGLIVLTWVAYWLPLNTYWANILQICIYILAPVTATTSAFFAARTVGWHRRAGKALYYVGFGMLAWCLGEITWVVYDQLLQINPYPSMGDYFYLAGYIGFLVGLVIQVRILHANEMSASQTLLFIFSAFMLTGTAIYFGVYQSIKPDYSLLENGIAIIYGQTDIALVLLGLALLAVLLEHRTSKYIRPWASIGLGLALTYVADIGFAMYDQQYITNAGFVKAALDSIWILSYVAMGYGFSSITWTAHHAPTE